MHPKIVSHKPPIHEVAPLSDSPHMQPPTTVYILYSLQGPDIVVKGVYKDFEVSNIERRKNVDMSVATVTWKIFEAPFIK